MKQLLIICVLALALAGCSKKETKVPMVATETSSASTKCASTATATMKASTSGADKPSANPSTQPAADKGKVAAPNSINSYGDVEIFGFDDDVDDDNDMDRFMEDYDD